jgi:broad specificity phosphatase PhoE
MSEIINFVFIRHGESLHNAIAGSITDPVIEEDLIRSLVDPSITQNGVLNSLYTSIQIDSFMRKHFKSFYGFDIICSSPMIRAIETAHYMCVENEAIYVMPHLREISGEPGDTARYLDRIFPIKDLKDQKKELESKGINVSYKYVLKSREPGNIITFIKWFCKHLRRKINKETFVFVATHSHVIYEYIQEYVDNNSGIIISISCSEDAKNINYKSVTRINTVTKYPKTDYNELL